MRELSTSSASVPVVSYGLGDAASAATAAEAIAELRRLDVDAPWGVVCSDVVLSKPRLAADAVAAATSAEMQGVPWLFLTAEGTGFDGVLIDNGNYLDRPTTPASYAARAVVSSSFTLAAVSLEALRAVHGDQLIQAGWAAGHGSFASSVLRFSYNGERASFWATVAAPEPMRLPPQRQATWLGAVRPDPTLTIVVRTTLARLALMERTLDSIAAAEGRRGVESLLVLADAGQEEIEHEADRLRDRYPDLPLQFAQVAARDVPSRTAGLRQAIETSVTDYVWFVDDDDWVTENGIALVKNAVHAAHRPVVLGPSEVYREVWSDRELTSSELERTFDPQRWYWAFEGWNSLPNCSIVVPRHLAAERLTETPPRYDMGEDYFLFLLLLTSPGVTVVTVDEPIAGISIREGADNVVTLEDRAPWLQSIEGFMSDLGSDRYASSEVLWALGQGLARAVTEADSGDPDTQLDERSSLRRWLRRYRPWA